MKKVNFGKLLLFVQSCKLRRWNDSLETSKITSPLQIYICGKFSVLYTYFGFCFVFNMECKLEDWITKVESAKIAFPKKVKLHLQVCEWFQGDWMDEEALENSVDWNFKSALLCLQLRASVVETFLSAIKTFLAEISFV